MNVTQVLGVLAYLATVAAGYVLRIPVLYPLVPVPIGLIPPRRPNLQAQRRSLITVENHNWNQGMLGNVVGPELLAGTQGFPGLPDVSLPAGLMMAQGGFSDGATDFPIFDVPNTQWVWPKGDKTGTPSVMNAGDAAAKATGSGSSSEVSGAAGVVFGGPVLSG